MANQRGLKREDVIELIAQKSGVSLYRPENAAQLLLAFEALESLRKSADRPGV